MGIARQHGDRRASNRGHSLHQDRAHKYLTSQGFDFYRMSGKTSNVYRNKAGQIIMVNATPTSPSNEMNHLRQAVQNGKEGKVATQAQSPTVALVAMADPFLLKTPTGRVAVQARNAALAGWVKRCLERHGPLNPKILMSAGRELGFSDSQLTRARTAAGAVAYTIPGSGAGKGKGQNPTLVALDHQVPEGASVIGRSAKPPVLGVQPEAPEHPIGENNGEGPEPREEPAQAPDPIDWDGTGATAPLMPSESGLKTPVPARAFMQLDETVRMDGDVGAAAQLLLSSLGLKTLDPAVHSLLRAAEITARRVSEDAAANHAAILKALQMVQS